MQVLIFKAYEIKYKKEVKQLIKAGIPKDELVKFSFHKNIFDEGIKNFKWMKKNEFRYKNEMFDIISSELKGDSIYFFCYRDVKESGLFAKLDDYVNRYLHDNPEKEKELQTILVSLNAFYLTDEVIFNDYSFPYENEYLSYYILLTPQEYYSINIPPPKPLQPNVIA
jgi:hypothetical protein